MQEEYQRALVVEREKEKRRWEESVRYQEQLEKQLTEKERRKQEAYEEFLKEKLMIDEIVRKIYEEDQRCVAWCLLCNVGFKEIELLKIFTIMVWVTAMHSRVHNLFMSPEQVNKLASGFNCPVIDHEFCHNKVAVDPQGNSLHPQFVVSWHFLEQNIVLT